MKFKNMLNLRFRHLWLTWLVKDWKIFVGRYAIFKHLDPLMEIA